MARIKVRSGSHRRAIPQLQALGNQLIERALATLSVADATPQPIHA
jgi:hypothetical protein